MGELGRGISLALTLATAFATASDEARQWPLPGCGRTGERLAALTRVSFGSLVLGRLVEAHADADAITAELGAVRPGAGERWGVWAAGRPEAVRAVAASGGMVLSGSRSWCSGATLVTHALVTASHAGAPVLCAVELGGGATPDPPTWTGPGMAAADTRTVRFDRAPAVPVGAPGDYLARPGFWAGAIGVAACWFGGTARLATTLRSWVAGPDQPDPHAYAHLGRVHAVLHQAQASLAAGAEAIDAHPRGDHAIVARSVRATVERAATEVADRVGRALGPGPMAVDADHAQLLADLAVYVRQEHGERDLDALGRDVARHPPSWCAGDDPTRLRQR